VDEAERADATARRLLDFAGSGGRSTLRPPVDVLPVDPLQPTDLPLLDVPPNSIRLDFWQPFCIGETCSRAPTWVDESEAIRTRRFNWNPDFDPIYALFTADTPFHVRNGFVGLPDLPPSELLSEGYATRLYLVLDRFEAAGGAFNVGLGYQFEADALLRVGEACGPELYAGSEPCLLWLFDFPAGLPAGEYTAFLEWTAPCGAWFEADVCDSPSSPLSLLYSAGRLVMVSEDYVEAAPNNGFPIQWPFDPWLYSEPLLEPEATP
jgi:hypothetical protein